MTAMQQDKETTLNLSGHLIIDRAAELKAELVAAIAENRRVFIDLSQAEELDLSCLQLVYAARRSASAVGKELHFVGTVPARIAKRLSSSGFLKGLPEKAEELEANLTDFQ
jgi:anti-anti-sigma regulatory factor